MRVSELAGLLYFFKSGAHEKFSGMPYLEGYGKTVKVFIKLHINP